MALEKKIFCWSQIFLTKKIFQNFILEKTRFFLPLSNRKTCIFYKKSANNDTKLQCKRIPTCRGDQLHIFFEQWSDFSYFFWKKLEIGSNSENSDGLINTFFFKGNAFFLLKSFTICLTIWLMYARGKILTSAFGVGKKNFLLVSDFFDKKNFSKFHFGKNAIFSPLIK